MKQVLGHRLSKFALAIAEEKSQLLCFGRYAKERSERVGRKLKTFTFLGFNHVCGRSKEGKFALIRIPSTKACSIKDLLRNQIVHIESEWKSRIEEGIDDNDIKDADFISELFRWHFLNEEYIKVKKEVDRLYSKRK